MHKINNALGQVLLAVRMGKTRIIVETGAGQHGVATATAAALMGLECVIYMGSLDIERQALNVTRMKMLGAQVVPVNDSSCSLKDAVNADSRLGNKCRQHSLHNRISNRASSISNDCSGFSVGYRERGQETDARTGWKTA